MGAFPTRAQGPWFFHVFLGSCYFSSCKIFCLHVCDMCVWNRRNGDSFPTRSQGPLIWIFFEGPVVSLVANRLSTCLQHMCMKLGCFPRALNGLHFFFLRGDHVFVTSSFFTVQQVCMHTLSMEEGHAPGFLILFIDMLMCGVHVWLEIRIIQSSGSQHLQRRDVM